MTDQHRLHLREADLGDGVRAVFSDRSGGVSREPYDHLNLGYHTGDDIDRAMANRDILGRALGAPVTFTSQVHGADVVEVARHRPNLRHEADALLTTAPRVGVGVMVADCVPVLLADPVAGVVAAAHAGRPGLVAGVVPGAIAAMIERGATAGRVRAAIGPSICGRCYEVPERMRDDVELAVPGTAATTSWGTPAVDIAAGVRRQLLEAGVGAIEHVAGCTYEDEEFFSYRRQGTTGRFAGVITLTAGAG